MASVWLEVRAEIGSSDVGEVHRDARYKIRAFTHEIQAVAAAVWKIGIYVMSERYMGIEKL